MMKIKLTEVWVEGRESPIIIFSYTDYFGKKMRGVVSSPFGTGVVARFLRMEPDPPEVGRELVLRSITRGSISWWETSWGKITQINEREATSEEILKLLLTAVL